MAYLDDIVIYSNSEKSILSTSNGYTEAYGRENADSNRECEFHTKKTEFCGFIIEPGQLSIDPKKIEAVVNWQNRQMLHN